MSRLPSHIRSRAPSWAADWVRDSSLLLTFQFLATLATSALAIVLARSLGPSSWGLFSGLLALSLATATLAEFGLGTWLLRELSALRDGSDPPSVHRVRASSLIVGALAATATLGLLLITASVVGLTLADAAGGTSTALLCLLGYTLALAFAACIEAYFRAERRLRVIGIAIGVEKVALIAGAGGLAVLGLGISAIAVGYLAAGVLRLLYVARMAFRRERVPLLKPAADDVRRYFVLGMPFAFNTMALTVIPRLDTFLIALVSTSAAGFFAIGDRVLGPAMIIPVVASRALYPFLVQESRDSRTPWHIAAAFFVGGGLIAAVAAVLAPSLVPLLFGADYSDAVRVVQVMLIALPFVFASNALLVRLYSLGRERAVLGVTLSASLVGTGSLVLGQLAFGPAGAAGGYVLRQVLFVAALAALGRLASAARPSRPLDPNNRAGPPVWPG